MIFSYVIRSRVYQISCRNVVDRYKWSLKVLWEVWIICDSVKWMHSLMRMRLILWRIFLDLWVLRWSLNCRKLWDDVIPLLYSCSVLRMPSLIVSWLGRPEFIESVYFSKDTFLVEVFDNIIEVSTGAFYIKIMRFASFLRVQIHSWNANISWILQSTSSERGAAWYWAVPPSRSFYIIFVSLLE